MTTKWQSRALYGIGAWTALGGVAALADPRGHCATFFGSAALADAPAARVVLFIAYAQLVAWGAGYVLAARHAAMRTPILAAGALGKACYGAITVVAVARGSGTTALLLTGAGDLLVAGFFVALLRPARAAAAPAAVATPS